ncbi:putative syntaxin-24-like [Hibiscus syriacus]|uniref:Syntaxin-24-like n=1 Tax=Hibiscus syriacus TaxID=106335 RepID=A0A6A2YML0_HIBSY|nr:protein SMAX1-LIKE 3-like [Hibiscus syriacus]KAE8680547.1 putative syntaxin-24-like [Hibiscus syriacus]
MRAGGCTVQQALTNEAANVVKQAVTLARRRGHAQVTPLHVANTMLSASTGLLRTACIQSHAHPLQCRALELCFNVALNRLPASASSPMLGTYWQYPSISNALVAAFKRAQAHQRRGSIENPQQPLLAVKIELEQLIISILDDPNVSRVMREAGFTSTQVKSNVEQAVSLEICSQNSPSVDSNKSRESSNADLALSQPHTASQVASNKTGKPRGSDPIIRDEDVMFVMENLMNEKRRSFVVVGECISSIEGVVNALIHKADKGNIKFVNLSFSSFGHLNRVEVEQKLEELKKHVGNCLGKGIVLNLGDLKWAIEYRASSSEQSRGYYCPVEHMIMEIGKLLVSNIGESGRFKLMGSATFQTYMRCKNGHPSLQTVWGLHPLTIPAGSLRFSLITDSELQSRATSNKVGNGSSWSTWAEPQHHDCPVVEPTQTVEPTSALRLYIAEHNYKDPRPHPSSSPNSACSSDVMEMEYVHKFKELNADNLTTLCTALENKVPWQKDIVPEIVTTILKCRSGMIRRKWKLVDGESTKEETWFFFQGVDVQAKEKIGKELARLVFGSQNNFVSIELSSFSSTKADSTEDCRSKRSRDEQSCSYIERFAEAVSCNPHRVFFIEDVEQSDYFSQMGFHRAIQRGRISRADGEEADLSDAIVILSCESFSSRSRACSPPAKLKSDGTFEEDKVGGSEETTSPCVSLDLNMSLDHDSLEEQSIQDIGLLQSVDRRIVFKTQEL